jgi:hypothetical protein
MCVLKIRKLAAVLLLILLSCAVGWCGSIEIGNASFEYPVIDPCTNPYLAIPMVPLWTELDVDPEGQSRNTGIFLNIPADVNTYITNANGQQLAFLCSQQGNALLQDLSAIYVAGKKYRLTVGVCSSYWSPLLSTAILNLALYYIDGNVRSDVAVAEIAATDLTATTLVDFSVIAPTVRSSDAWAGKNIGVAIRATGELGRFWDIDNVRLNEFQAFPDFTGNSFVDFSDFAKLAGEWMSCTATTTDLTGDGCINFQDLDILGEHWLEQVQN